RLARELRAFLARNPMPRRKRKDGKPWTGRAARLHRLLAENPHLMGPVAVTGDLLVRNKQVVVPGQPVRRRCAGVLRAPPAHGPGRRPLLLRSMPGRRAPGPGGLRTLSDCRPNGARSTDGAGTRST